MLLTQYQLLIHKKPLKLNFVAFDGNLRQVQVMQLYIKVVDHSFRRAGLVLLYSWCARLTLCRLECTRLQDFKVSARSCTFNFLIICTAFAFKCN